MQTKPISKITNEQKDWALYLEIEASFEQFIFKSVCQM